MNVMLPNGKVIEGVPEGTPKEVIQQKAIMAGLATKKDFMNAFEKTMVTPGALEENIATIATAVAAEPIAGIAGIAQSLNPFAEDGAGADAVQSTRDALTFRPRIKEAQEGQQALGETLQPVGEAFSKAETTLGETTLDYTGSEALAAAAHTLPTAILEVLGVAGIKGFKPSVRKIKTTGQSVAAKASKLISPPMELIKGGEPAEALNKMLNERGLVYENLTPEAQALIPERTEAGQNVGKILDDVLMRQMKTGGTDDALAGFKVVGDKIKPDHAAIEAIKQGFEPGFVQAIKTSDKGTKIGMKRMTNIMRRVKGNKALAAEGLRPTDVVGDSFTRRVTYIRDVADEARESLDRIARTQLKGVPMDSDVIVNKLRESLGKLDIDMPENGKPALDFDLSMISKDKTSQKVLKDLIDLMAEGGKPDALRFHKMKKQLDTMIDYRKKSKDGLTDAGRKVLSSIRRELNQELRKVNQSYAKVNDTLSTSLTALGDMEEVLGKSIDMFGPGANKAIGQDLRGLMSNRKTRVKQENAVKQIDATAKELGGKFDDNIHRLLMFADSIEDRFGAVADTSLKGELESTVKSAINQGARNAAREKVAETVAKGAERMRGINDFNAYKSLNALLK